MYSKWLCECAQTGVQFALFFPELNKQARSTAAVAHTGRVAAGGAWQTDRRGEPADFRAGIGGFPGESAATDLPGSAL